MSRVQFSVAGYDHPCKSRDQEVWVRPFPGHGGFFFFRVRGGGVRFFAFRVPTVYSPGWRIHGF